MPDEFANHRHRQPAQAHGTCCALSAPVLSSSLRAIYSLQARSASEGLGCLPSSIRSGFCLWPVSDRATTADRRSPGSYLAGSVPLCEHFPFFVSFVSFCSHSASSGSPLFISSIRPISRANYFRISAQNVHFYCPLFGPFCNGVSGRTKPCADD